MVRVKLSCLLCVGLLLSLSSLSGFAQKKEAPPVCYREDALPQIQLQIDQAWAAEESVERITVLIRAADLLWPYREDKARETFGKAFEWAAQRFKEKGNEQNNDGKFLIVKLPDQRFRVLTAIARRDPAWAQQLTERALEEQAKDAENATTKKDPAAERATSENLLNIAGDLLTANPAAAYKLAQLSLRYPASLWLPKFLYDLAEKDHAVADRFYQEAIAAYGDKPMSSFLYLSPYPFALSKAVGEMPSSTTYIVSASYKPTPALARMFVQTLLQRAQQEAENPTAANAPGERIAEVMQMWLALSRLESAIGCQFPDLAETAKQAQASLYAGMAEKAQKNASATLSRDRPAPSPGFAAQIENAEKEVNPDRREARLAMAVMYGAHDEPLEKVVAAADKITDTKLRESVLAWVYFDRAQKAIKAKQLEAGTKLAGRVIELDQRAYLYALILQESLKEEAVDQQRVRALLEETLAAAQKSPDTMTKARALLAVAFYYGKLDTGRALSVLDDAVKCINRVEKVDFSQQYAMRKIEGKEFGSYAAFNISAFNPQETFRELARLDYNGVLFQAGNFTNKPLRALINLSLLEGCLAHGKTQPKASRKR